MHTAPLFALLAGFLLAHHVQAGQTLTVDFTNATLTVTNEHRVVLKTPVVLPRGNYYPVPVSGVVQKAVLGPTWVPTDNMHRDHPGRYQRYYGPYQRGNAMGHCKLHINFDNSSPSLEHVRIHGNAKPQHLGKRLSRSCIRIPNKHCRPLVQAIQANPDTTTVQFVR